MPKERRHQQPAYENTHSGKGHTKTEAGPSNNPRSPRKSTKPNPSSSKSQGKGKAKQQEAPVAGIIDKGSWSIAKDGQPMMTGGQGPPGQFPLQSQKNIHRHFQTMPSHLQDTPRQGFDFSETTQQVPTYQQYLEWYGKNPVSPEIYGAKPFVGSPDVNSDEQEPQYEVEEPYDLQQLPSYSSGDDGHNPLHRPW